MRHTHRDKKFLTRGFTLLEVLLVVAIIAILAGIVIIAINPGKQLAEARNSTRRTDVSTIINGIHQYTLDNSGIMPATITVTATEICSTTGVNCAGLIDLGVVTTGEKYLTAFPKDPRCPTGCATYGTGYRIAKNTTTGRLTVNAPSAELSVTISVTK